MRVFGKLLFCLAFFAAAPCFADDPQPPALTVSYLAQPPPIVQHGATVLAYEMVITNYANSRYVLNSSTRRRAARAFRSRARRWAI